MAWQDIVITVSIILMSYALVPQVIRGFKLRKNLISLQTSFITTISIYAVTVAFFSLGLYFSAVMDFVIATLWLVIFIQGIAYKW